MQKRRIKGKKKNPFLPSKDSKKVDEEEEREEEFEDFDNEQEVEEDLFGDDFEIED